MLKLKIRVLLILILMMGSISISSCNKKTNDSFTADFSYSMVDDNHVLFTNNSSGEYYSLVWDFGNGETETSTDKKQEYNIYYPEQDDYEVKLKLVNYTGDQKSTSKTINITSTDLLVSFTATLKADDPNTVILKNTSQGEFDSFKWKFREREVENIDNYAAWFPFEGIFTVELELTKNNNTYSSTQTVSIANDDPDYFDKLKLVWSDEFDGPTINTNNWKFDTGQNGWGNNELENYTNGDNAEIVDSNLVITARKVNENTAPGSYTSSRLVSFGKQEFMYGRFEIRAKLPEGVGIWPAIWMLGSNYSSAGWPACGEIDIMEYVGFEPNTVYSTAHTTAGSGANGSGSSMNLPTAEEDFHIYGLLWTEEKLVFYVDTPDNIVHTYNPSVKTEANWPFNQKAFFILNIAVGGNWGGAQGVDNSIFPQTMKIDYVRVYQEAK